MNLITYEPTSHAGADPNGRLFWFEGGLYRGIYPPAAPLFARLFAEGVVDELVGAGMVESDASPLTVPGYGMVVRHRRIPFVTYPFEWCGAMLREAARLTLDLAARLERRGLELNDANPWNVLFEGTRPVFVDLGSIVERRPGRDWRAGREFISSFLNPLRMIAAGQGTQARTLLADHTRWGVPDAELPAELRTPPPPLEVGALRCALEAIELPTPKTEWSEYYTGFKELEPEHWTPKTLGVRDLVAARRPRTLLDMASNAGWYALLAAETCDASIAAFDVDETCVTALHREASRRGAPVLPLLMDFGRPSAPHGPDGEYPSAEARLRCDGVLALALVHHLVFRQGLGFETIVERLDAFTGQWAIVEWIPAEDRHVAQWYRPEFSWYTLANLLALLRPVFPHIDVLPSNREPRKLLWCRRDA